MLVPDTELEILGKTNYKTIVGIDEAGRGAWAGPVSVGYYVFAETSDSFSGVRDSKRISPKKRKLLAEQLKQQGGVVFKDNNYIDKVGISIAIVEAIEDVMQLFPDAYYLIDGKFAHQFSSSNKQIIKGDDRVYSIAAASILAKYLRDDYMIKLDAGLGRYHFSSHKGYGTKLHQQCLEKHGPSNFHRKSYAPVAKYFS